MGAYRPLPPRYMRVAGLYADTDMSRRQIAAAVGVADSTVENIIGSVYRYYGVRSRPALRSVMLALELAPAGTR